MSGFKRLKHADQLVLKQRGGVVVFLESTEDFEIIHKRWFFDEGQDICFQAADTYGAGRGGGGCRTVIDLVTDARSNGIQAYGLVDRDVLLGDQNWLLWWECADQTFSLARPYGAHIRVLLRWELENYLLDPDTMRIEANDEEMTSTHTAESVLARCLGCANELKDRAAASIAARAENLTAPAPGFGCNPLKVGAELTDALHEFLRSKGLGDPVAAMIIARERIDQFDAPTDRPHVRWERLLRILDGKAALKYISRQMGVRFDERRAALARRMYERGTVPAEIRGYIDEFKGAI
mgnify:CR=1 FL=1